VDIDLSVDARGGLRLRSGTQRFYEGRLAFDFPLLFSGIAEVCEWYDDGEQRYRIEVNVANRTWGPLFGYKGWFTAEWAHAQGAKTNVVPPGVLPRRCEKRE